MRSDARAEGKSAADVQGSRLPVARIHAILAAMRTVIRATAISFLFGCAANRADPQDLASSTARDPSRARQSDSAVAPSAAVAASIIDFTYRGQFENGVEVVADAYLGPPVLLSIDF